MFPTLPDDLHSLEVDELIALRASIRSICIANFANTELSAEDLATTNAMFAKREELAAVIDEKKAAAAAEAERAARLQALNDEEEDPTPPAAEPEVTEPDVEAGAKTPKLPTTFGQAPDAPLAPEPKRLDLSRLVASDGLLTKAQGESFTSWAEMAAAAVERSASIRGNSEVKHVVARAVGNYPKERQLTEDINFNMSKFEPDELMAALCAPAVPYYGLACANTTRRPVFNSLPQFAAPRGKVSIMPSPVLSDITTGFGIWSAANEASTNAVKSACQTITCGSPTEYQIYGIYRCLTVRNLLAMTYPELVEAWLNRLGAAHARLAEQNLLNAMGTAATSLTTPTLGYNAMTTVTSTILNYIGLYQESQRWDITDNMEAWLPRWVLPAMKMDFMRRRTTNGNFQTVPTDAQIESQFRAVGVNPHWFIDTPTWATAVPGISSGGALNRFPANVQMLIAPPGKFAVMDRGELSIGVTGNGIYRDNTSNSRNEFTFFFENFEGIVNTTSCPAHILDFNVCYNGAQVDDLIINCQGGDEGGYQS